MTRFVNRILATTLLSALTRASCSDEVGIKRLVGLEYPPVAAQAQIQGEVVLKCILDKEGRVHRVEAISGHPILKQAASKNVTKWVFRLPGGDQPNNINIKLIYNFRLEGVCVAPNCTSEFSFDSPNLVTLVTQTRHWNPSVGRD